MNVSSFLQKISFIHPAIREKFFRESRKIYNFKMLLDLQYHLKVKVTAVCVFWYTMRAK